MGKKKPIKFKLIDKNKEIDLETIIGSMVDPVGRVFGYNKNIYRGIFPRAVPMVKTFMSMGKNNLNKLFSKGLIRTKIVNLTSETFPLILKHEYIRFKSLPFEWSPTMLRDSAKMVVDLGTELWKRGYSYKDGQSYNTFPNFTKPIFIDFGSILPKNKLPNSRHIKPLIFPWEWSGMYINYFIKDLEKVTTNINREHAFSLRKMYANTPLIFFREMSEYLDNAKFSFKRTEWTNYGIRTFNFDNLNPKQKSFLTFLYNIDIKTAIDIGANKGRFSTVMADRNIDVIAFDIDISSVDQLYLEAKETNRNILSLKLDFMNLTPQIRGHLSAETRLKSDLSVFLAVIHHLCLRKEISFEEIASRLDKLSNKYSIVEFIPLGDKHVGGWKKPSWYTLDNFVKVMKRFNFSKHIILPSAPDPRKLILFER